MAGTKSKFVGGSLNFYDKTHNGSFPVGVWADCPLLAMLCDPSVAYGVFEDYTNINVAVATTVLTGYTVTQATAGQLTISDAAGGVLQIDSNSTTDGQGLNVQYQAEIFKPAASKDIWFEAYFNIDELANCDWFVGLSETDTAIIDTSANASANHIGWHSVTGDGIALFSSEKAGTGATKTGPTLVEDTNIALGFHVKGVTSVDHYVNGAKQSTSHVTANIPIVEMCPSFVCQSTGTQDPILHLDWWKCVQLR